LEPAQLGDREGALVGVVAACVEKRRHRGLAVEKLPELHASAVLVLQLHVGEYLGSRADLVAHSLSGREPSLTGFAIGAASAVSCAPPPGRRAPGA